MRGESDVSSTVGVIEDLLARLRWLSGFQVVIFVYPVPRDLNGQDVESLRTRLDLTDDQVVSEGRYPDSMRTREVWWSNLCMVWRRRGKTGPCMRVNLEKKNTRFYWTLLLDDEHCMS